MSGLDWFIVVSMSSAVLLFVLALFFLLSFIQLTRRWKTLSKKRVRNKKKRHKLKRQLANISKKRTRKIIQLSICLFLSFIILSVGLYGRYYQSLHLNADDKEIISQSYFVLEEVKAELSNIKSGSDVDKSQQKLKDMLSMLVSYTSRQPSTTLSIDGQQQLRNYYKKATELGTNLYGQTTAQLNDSKRIDGFLTDISSLQKKQKEIFETFGISSDSVKKQN
ncbi:hypothetical protein JZO73_03135 [Enterococcus plantarum]|uniref:hypothetical protein n=1 Tax=Enterococcus plantarum TaxID=1077675 RepID=UPI001A8E45D4|nr:hypothetical protein [Enterococcus plantarum]MBO0466522.1 hypothetical protein [Enterococcus plantarum]